MVYVFFAEGFEEVEAVAAVDLLRRANIETKTVGVGGISVRGAHGITVACDIAETEAVTDGLSMVVLPGGMPGTVNLERSETVQSMIDYAVERGKWVAAICAAPSILAHKGLLEGRWATCDPGFLGDLTGAKLSKEHVCVDGKIITGRGMGVSVDFGLKLVEVLLGRGKSDAIKGKLQCRI